MSPITSIMNLEKHANDPLQVLGTPKKVSFDEYNLRDTAVQSFKRAPTSGAEEDFDHQQEEVIVKSNEERILLNNIPENVEADELKEVEELEAHGVVTPKDEDILSGRGAGVNHHPGNVFFRKLISGHKQHYLKSDPGEKKRIIRRIVEAAAAHGRFLKQDTQTELWSSITMDEARKKTGQALRENAPSFKKNQYAIKREIAKATATIAEMNAATIKELNAATAAARIPTTFLPSSTQERRRLSDVSTVSSSPPSPPTLLQSSSRLPPPLSLINDASSALGSSRTRTSTIKRPSSSSSSSLFSSLLPASETSLLWRRMNMLQEKQNQLKRKQRELEDEQHELMQYFNQMTATLATHAPSTITRPSSIASSSHHSSLMGLNSYDRFNNNSTATATTTTSGMNDGDISLASNNSDHSTDYGGHNSTSRGGYMDTMNAMVRNIKKRRIMVAGH